MGPFRDRPLSVFERLNDQSLAITPKVKVVVGATTTGDHLQPEDRPADVLPALMPFLRQHAI